MADKKKEKRILEERVYVIPLKRIYWGRRTNRADRAVRFVRRFVQRHVKVDRVVISNEVNEYIWSRGREKPPRRVKILVRVYEREEKTEGEEEAKKLKIAVVRLAPKEAKPGIVTAQKTE